MKFKVVKAAGLLVIASMLAFAVGCNTGNQAGNQPTGNNGNASSNANGEGDALEPITFTAFFPDPNNEWNNMEDDIGKVLQEKTGVTLDIEFAVGDPDQKINLIAASGEYPDLIAPKGTSGTLVEAGALLDLTDLINEHAPNIKKMIGDQMDRLKYSSEDESIYFIPNLETIDHQSFDATGTFNLQHAVVKELGYPEINTLQDYENAIKAYKEKYPEIDGQPTIGVTLIAEDWRSLISVTNPAFIATGAPDDGEFYIDPETYEAIVHYKRPEEREYFRWLNHMNNIGLLDPESFVQKYDQYKAKIASGRVLGTIDQKWQIQEAENALKAAGKPERAYGHYNVTLDGTYKTASFMPTGFSGGQGIGITVDCKDPVRAIKFLDYLASEEGQILVNWGVEGVTYDVIDGKRVLKPEIAELKRNDGNTYKKTTGIGNYLLSLRYGDGVQDSTGNYFTQSFPEEVRNNYTDIEKEILAAYGKEFWKDFFPDEEEFEVSPWGRAWNLNIPADSEYTVIKAKFDELVDKRIAEAVLAKPEEFDAIYDAMLDDFERIDVPKMEAEFSKHLKARLDLWGVTK
ncbi:extracellular solute-binding protein [Xylanibacillus composti]|uniref:ABC transporter substrate-binding protein n=1 Tax=Xylanibacillus composti TaxID=1572762 RepID=A0A8J4H8H9_9BACL|nr:ABC transporter substrate-binding protein [Xylanibacillus composti]MDT9726157.1 extracellular solute-binding protein [Xylanibacillus composti]GIQ70608.1 ABC transporter substrate-binding protein [Xylanibacillus composti]